VESSLTLRVCSLLSLVYLCPYTLLNLHHLAIFLRKVTSSASRYSVRQVGSMSGKLWEILEVNEWLQFAFSWHELATPQILYVASNWLLEFCKVDVVVTVVCTAIGDWRWLGFQGRKWAKFSRITRRAKNFQSAP
jgi:hypothetical protein